MKTIGRQFFWLGIITVLGGLFSYLTRRLFATNMTVEEYGLFYSVFALIFFFQYFRDLGLQESTIYHINKYRASKDLSKIKGTILMGAVPQFILGIIITSILFLFKDFLISNYFKTPLAEATYLFLLLVFIIEPVIVVLSSVLLGLEKTILFRAVDFSRYFFIFISAYFLFGLYPAYMVPSIAYVLGTIVAIIIYIIVSFVIYLRTIKYTPTVSTSMFSELLGYAIPITFSTAGIIILQYSDILLLTYLKDSFSVGLYNIALPAITIAVVLMTPIYIVLFPAISRLFHSKKSSEISSLLSLIYNNILIILLPISAFFMIFPAEIISVLFNSNYVEAINTLRVFALTFIFIVLKDVGFSAMAGLGIVRERSKTVYVAAFTNVILNLLLIPLFGATGAAIGTGIGFGLMALMGFFYVNKLCPIRIDYMMQFRIMLVGILFFGALFVLSKIMVFDSAFFTLLFSGLLSIPLFVMLASLFGLVNREKYNALRSHF